jgi:transcriptional regulator with XRE-family HTH domain
MRSCTIKAGQLVQEGFKMSFNEKLIALRKSNGLSQEELGDRVGVTRQTVSKWELGQTTPEMDKLIELSKLFGISIDEFVGIEKEAEPQPQTTVYYPRSFNYEYKSKKYLFGLPLVHINIGVGVRHAKGIIAIGTIARGFLSVGVVSMGILSFGALSLGAIAIGALSIGLAAIGAIVAGLIAFGGIAFGLFAVGGAAIGYTAIGGLAVAKDVALGGYATGHVAIGDTAVGEYTYQIISKLTQEQNVSIKETILREYPNYSKWLLNLLFN